MSEQNTGAKWVHTQEFKLNQEQGGCIRVSEKGAISVSLFNQDGSRQDLFFVTAPVAQRMVDTAMVNIPGLEELLASDTMRAIQDNKAKLKEQAKLERQKAQVANKLANQFVALEQQRAILEAKLAEVGIQIKK